MADKIDVKVEGIPKAIENLKRYQVIKREAIKLALRESGFKVERDAKLICKQLEIIDTGRLRASISTNWSGSGKPEGRTGTKAESGDGVGEPGGKKDLTVVTGTNVFYGPYNEFGTKKMSARPFLYPAYFSNEGDIVKRIEKILKKEL